MRGPHRGKHNQAIEISWRGYNIANAPPGSRNVEDQKSKVGGGEEHDECPGQDLERVPGTVPAVATRIVDLLHLLFLSLSHPSFLHLPLLFRGRHACGGGINF